MNILFENQQVILGQFLQRPFYERELFQKISLDNYATGLIGGRGVGKTTLLLKLALLHGAMEKKALYVSADHLYFLQNNLLELVDQLYKETDVRFLCVDEIHKHDNWQQILKNIVDIYPSMKLIFTSSSRIDLVRSQYDLSRRVSLFSLPGLSFREYLSFTHQIELPIQTLSALLTTSVDLELSQAVPEILKFFKNYLMRGYYPFSKVFTQELEFYQALGHAVQKTIYEDIATSHALKTSTLMVLEKIYRYVLSITPGELSVNKLANVLGKDFSDVSEYLRILEQAGLVRFLFTEQTGKAALRNPTKLFPDNPNLIYAALMGQSDESVLGMVRECFALSHLQNANCQVLYPRQGDLAVDPYVFEIGGRNKTAAQIQSIENGFVFKEGVLTGLGRTRPLYLLGFLY